MNMTGISCPDGFLGHFLLDDLSALTVQGKSGLRQIFNLWQINIEPDKGRFWDYFERDDCLPRPIHLSQYLLKNRIQRMLNHWQSERLPVL